MEKTIDTLPDELLNNILSFLPMRTAFRMSFLSKRWKNIWDNHTLSSIDLTTMFKHILPKAELMNFVDKYLLVREINKVNIQSFRLSIYSFDSPFVAYLNTWIKRLIRWELYKIYNYPSNYAFPHTVLSAKSLQKLTLEGCRLVCTNFGDINLVSLKELFLKYVFINDESIELLVKSCGAMEKLCLENCNGVSSLKVTSLHALNKLTLLDNFHLVRVEIDEPSLVCIHLRYHRNCTDHNDVKFANGKGLKKLILCYADITSEWLTEQLSVLNHLENLELQYCGKISSLNISSRRLKRLLLMHRDDLSKVRINTPNLQLFSLRSMYKSNIKVLQLSLNAPPTLEVELDIDAKDIMSRSWYIELLTFICAFDSSRLTLRTNLPGVIIPQDWVDRETRLSDVLRLKPCSLRDYMAKLKGELLPGEHTFIGLFARTFLWLSLL